MSEGESWFGESPGGPSGVWGPRLGGEGGVRGPM